MAMAVAMARQGLASVFRLVGPSSICEWKGPALYWDLIDGARCLPRIAWSYPQALAGVESLTDFIAFYAHHLESTLLDDAI